MLDPSLRGFVEASDEAEAERCLTVLIEERAAPLARKVVAGRLAAYGGPSSAEDLEDVVADVLLALVSRLQSLRAHPTSDPIESFTDYTAVVSYNAFAHYLRRKHPEHSRLKHRLRYVLMRERRFGLWQSPDGLCCGLAEWRSAPASPAATENLDRLRTAPERWLRWTRKGSASRDDPGALLDAVLQALGGPVEFDRLVGAIAVLYPTSQEDRDAACLATLPDKTAVPVDVALDRRRPSP